MPGWSADPSVLLLCGIAARTAALDDVRHAHGVELPQRTKDVDATSQPRCPSVTSMNRRVELHHCLVGASLLEFLLLRGQRRAPLAHQPGPERLDDRQLIEIVGI